MSDPEDTRRQTRRSWLHASKAELADYESQSADVLYDVSRLPINASAGTSGSLWSLYGLLSPHQDRLSYLELWLIGIFGGGFVYIAGALLGGEIGGWIGAGIAILAFLGILFYTLTAALRLIFAGRWPSAIIPLGLILLFAVFTPALIAWFYFDW